MLFWSTTKDIFGNVENHRNFCGWQMILWAVLYIICFSVVWSISQTISIYLSKNKNIFLKTFRNKYWIYAFTQWYMVICSIDKQTTGLYWKVHNILYWHSSLVLKGMHNYLRIIWGQLKRLNVAYQKFLSDKSPNWYNGSSHGIDKFKQGGVEWLEGRKCICISTNT